MLAGVTRRCRRYRTHRADRAAANTRADPETLSSFIIRIAREMSFSTAWDLERHLRNGTNCDVGEKRRVRGLLDAFRNVVSELLFGVT